MAQLTQLLAEMIFPTGAVRLGGPPSGMEAGHPVQIRASLPGQIKSSACNCNSLVWRRSASCATVTSCCARYVNASTARTQRGAWWPESWPAWRSLNLSWAANGGRDANMSAGHLSRQFKIAYGESPYSYLMTRRIERAMALLRRCDPAESAGTSIVLNPRPPTRASPTTNGALSPR